MNFVHNIIMVLSMPHRNGRLPLPYGYFLYNFVIVKLILNLEGDKK